MQRLEPLLPSIPKTVLLRIISPKIRSGTYYFFSKSPFTYHLTVLLRIIARSVMPSMYVIGTYLEFGNGLVAALALGGVVQRLKQHRVVFAILDSFRNAISATTKFALSLRETTESAILVRVKV